MCWRSASWQPSTMAEDSMCYSAQIQADYRRYVRMFGAQMNIHEFARLFFERAEGSKAKDGGRQGGQKLRRHEFSCSQHRTRKTTCKAM